MKAMPIMEYTLGSNWSKPRLFLFLQMLVLLLWPVNAGTIRGTVATCHPRDRDPCANFPELCSAGNGLCVVKKPCEYECVCPPDGRVGRDCSNGKGQANDGGSQGSSGGSGTPSNDKQVDSLLVFPPDLFWDLNHVDQQDDLIKTIPVPGVTEPQMITSSTSISATGQTTTKAASSSGATEVIEGTTTANALNPTEISAGTSAEFETATNAYDMAPLALPGKVIAIERSMPAAIDLTSAEPVTGLSLQRDVETSSASPATTQNPETQTVSQSSSSNEFTDTVMLEHTSSPTIEGNINDTYSEGFQELLILNDSLPHTTDTPIISGTSSRVTVFSSSEFPMEPNSSSANQNFGRSQDNSPPHQLTTSGSDQLLHELHAADAPLSTTPSPPLNTGTTMVNKPQSNAQGFPIHNNFPTFFSGSAHQDSQENSDNRALHRTVQRIFHPVDAFQMLPKP